jgi:hypothetical protein
MKREPRRKPGWTHWRRAIQGSQTGRGNSLPPYTGVEELSADEVELVDTDAAPELE